jgi:hypothetical protein
MFQIGRVFLIVAIGMVLALGLPPAFAQTGVLKFGEKFDGELSVRSPVVHVGPTAIRFYGAAIPVSLKAGQSISISATVIGNSRQVALWLRDPTGANLANTDATVKTGQLTFEEVNVTGKYMVVVGSNLVGPFTLRVTDPSNADGDIKSLESRIEQLEKELAGARAKLKALKENSRGKLNSPIEK